MRMRVRRVGIGTFSFSVSSSSSMVMTSDWVTLGWPFDPLEELPGTDVARDAGIEPEPLPDVTREAMAVDEAAVLARVVLVA